MAVVLSHPTGNANVRAVAMGLLQANFLEEFHTSIASFPGSLLQRLSGIKVFSEIKRRSYDSALSSLTYTHPWCELGRMVASKTGFKKLIKHESGLFCVDAVYKDIDRRVARKLKPGVKAIYAYEDEAFYSFRKAKSLGIKCLYDLPIGYWRTAQNLLQKEYDRWPEWISTMPNFIDSENKLFRKDEELRLADRIFVASQFTASTLDQYPGKLAPVEIVPYGFPAVAQNRKYNERKNAKLKLLFVGGLSQRKGIADVFSVAEQLNKHVTLTIVGQRINNNCKALDIALSKHTWHPSLPHAAILELMKQSDVLLFPSLFEGFGLVITEAMSQGTPVITTERTVGPDFIENDRNGWLIKAGSTEALLSAIEKILQQPSCVAAIGQEAIKTANSRPWGTYGYELADVVKKAL